MNLSEMRSEYRDALAGRVSDYDDGRVDKDLNKAWQYRIANLVLGDYHEGTVPLTLKVGQDVYDVDSDADMTATWSGMLRQLRYRDSVAYRDRRQRIVLYKTPEVWRDLIVGNTQPTTGRPGFVLWYNRKLTFWPEPNAAEEVDLHGSIYHPKLTSVGIANDSIAQAVVNLAVHQRAHYRGFDDISQQFAALAKDSERELRQQGLTAPRELPRMLDF